jgi:ABC-type sugar transport system ATPase subunit
MMIACRNLSKTFRAFKRGAPPVRVLENVAFAIEEGEFYILLGPSGSGKTTTLRAVAGLERPDKGEIDINGEVVFSAARGIVVPPEERPIAMVFQSYALWPHMNVYNNIAFPLRSGIRRVAREEARRRIGRVLDLLHLTEQAERPVSTLSGGQQQRVALARALALEPAVLLMDEPLSNLDAKLRAQLRVELKELTKSIGITTLYVTHDQVEAMVMGDRVAVMNGGAILQEGRAAELYQRPRDLFVARFLGEMNFVPGTLESISGDRGNVASAVGKLSAICAEAAPAVGDVLIGFRPEDVTFAAGGGNSIPGRVAATHYLGDVVLYAIETAAGTVQVRRPKTEIVAPGESVVLNVPAECCLAFATGGDVSRLAA